MKWEGEERRSLPCRKHGEDIQTLIKGFSELSNRLELVEKAAANVHLALHGSVELKMPGMVAKQEFIRLIMLQIEPLVPYMKPLMFISYTACTIIIIKFFGVDSFHEMLNTVKLIGV